MSQTINFSNSTPAAPSNTVNAAWQNDNSNPPNISVNVPSGVGGTSNVVAKSSLTAQTAAITATTIFAIPSTGAGMYRISYVATVTTAAGAGSPSLGGTTGFQVKFTNLSDAVVKTSNPTTATVSAVNATGTTISGDLFAYCAASTNLQYLFGYTAGTGATFTYDITIYVEYIGG
jgi:hypothetical protein